MRAFHLSVPLGLVALTALSGCLGSDNPDFNRQALDAGQLIRSFEDQPLTLVDDMPSGSADYRGVAVFSYDTEIQSLQANASDLLADVTLTTNFDTNDVSGAFSNFNSRDGNVGGTIALDNGVVAGNQMEANAAGTITDGETATALELDVNGVFRGDEGSAVSGVISGSYTPEGGTAGEIFGVFGADIN